MNMEEQVAAAILAELTRQAEMRPDQLRLEGEGEDSLTVHGRIDLPTLAMAVVGAVAGGP